MSDLLAKVLDAYMDGFADDQLGDVDGFGWFGRFDADLAILETDSLGFNTLHTYADPAELDAAWHSLYVEFIRWSKDA